MRTPKPEPSDPGHPLLAGLRAARQNLLPALLLQALMAGLLLAWRFHEPTRQALDHLAGWRGQAGYAFAFFASIAGSALLPEILRVLIFQHGRPTRANASHLAFTVPLWGGLGLLVDAFYRLQGQLFGTDATLAVVVGKVAFDQFVASPLFFTPLIALLLEWRHRGYDPAAFLDNLTPVFYRDRVLPIQVAGWAVWIPCTTVIYSLPPSLQIPFYVLASSFWVLLLTCIHQERAAVSGPSGRSRR